MPAIITVVAMLVFLFLVIGAFVFLQDRKQKRAAIRKMKATQKKDVS